MTTINLISYKDFKPYEEIFLFDALRILEVAINSDAFKKQVLDFTFKGEKKFNYNKGMSNEQIYGLFMSGQEETNNIPDNKIDLTLEISKNCPNNVLGTTYGKKRTATYRCKLNDMSEADYAGHIAHEYCHYLGFSHSKYDNSTRKYTVPYALGNILKALCAAILLNLVASDLKEFKTLEKELLNK